MVQPTTFRTALPYGIGALAVGAIGAGIALTASTTVATVAGVALALFGATAFYGVVACGFAHRGKPEAFQRNIGSFMATAAGAVISNMISTVANAVLINMVTDCINNRRRQARF